MKKRHSLLFAVAVSVTLACAAVIVFGNQSFADQAPPDPSTELQSVFDKTQQNLSLTAAQTALWNEAETYSLAQMKEEFSRMSSTRSEIQSSLSETSPDLHALATKLEDDMDAHVAAAKKNHELWLAVYDSLDADQQTILRKAFVTEFNKMEKMRRMGPPPGGNGSTAPVKSSM